MGSHSPVCCSLTVYELKDGKHPEFAALSHGCGKEERNIPILVDGRKMHITTGLNQALRQLRKFQTAGTLQVKHWWAEEVCIDQGNLGETGPRTELMDVFSQAPQTVAWLGPADVWCDRASKTIRQRSFDRGHWGALKAFFERPYWSQVWILQELGPSRNIHIAYGNNIISWRELEDFFSAYRYSSGMPNPHYASATARIRKRFLQKPIYPGAPPAKTSSLAEIIREAYRRNSILRAGHTDHAACISMSRDPPA
jgi:hypothetical protein